MIHRWGWTLVLNPDGTTTAWNPDRTKVLHSHSPQPAPGKPPGRVYNPSIIGSRGSARLELAVLTAGEVRAAPDPGPGRRAGQ